MEHTKKGLAERLGSDDGEHIKWESSPTLPSSSSSKINWKDPSFYTLFVIVILLSIICEFLYNKGTFVLIFSLIIISLWCTRARQHDNIRTPSGYYPWFGHLFHIYTHWHDFFDLETIVSLEGGNPEKSIFCASLPLGRNFIFMTDPKVIDVCFRTQFGDAEKGEEVNSALQPMLGHGIFASDGKLWKKHRSIASRMFTVRSLRDYMFEVFVNTTNELTDKFDEFINKNEEFDLYNMYNRLTLEAFTAVAFGVNLGCIKNAPEPLQFATSFDRGAQIVTLRFFDSSWKIRKFLNISYEKELTYHTKVINNFVVDVIEERKQQYHNQHQQRQQQQQGEEKLAQKYDLLSLFIKDDPTISDDELRDITINFIIAGRDTTAQLLSWFTYLITLKENEHAYNKVLNEIEQYCPLTDNKQLNDSFDYQQINKLTYLENALLESLRLYPSVPHLVRFAKNDIKLPTGNIIRKGDGVIVPTYAMGRMPWLWKDPLKFDPTRFESKVYTPSEYPAFNIPPRLCLGKHVALLEAKIAIVKIFRKYKVVPVDNQEITYIFSMTNQMKNGFKVNLIPKY